MNQSLPLSKNDPAEQSDKIPDPAQQLRQEAARKMGMARTEAKRAAVRRNGKLGGRPKGYIVSDETRRKISQAKKDTSKQQAEQKTLGSSGPPS